MENTRFSTRPATLAERIGGIFWRVRFRFLRNLADGWEWALREDERPTERINEILCNSYGKEKR